MANVIREKEVFLPLINGVVFERLGRFSISASIAAEVADGFLAVPGYRLADEDEVPEHLAGTVATPAAPAAPAVGHLAGVQDPDGTVRELADLRKDELLKIAEGMGIEGFAKMTKPQLVEAIKKEEVEPVDEVEPAPAAEPEPEPAPETEPAPAAPAAEKKAEEFF